MEDYFKFAQSAAQVPDAPYNPRNIEGSTANLAQSATGRGSSADAGYLNAASRNPPNFEYESKPNFGYANTVAGIGPSIEAISQRMDADKFYKQQAGNYGGYSNSSPYSQQQLMTMFQEGKGAW